MACRATYGWCYLIGGDDGSVHILSPTRYNYILAAKDMYIRGTEVVLLWNNIINKGEYKCYNCILVLWSVSLIARLVFILTNEQPCIIVIMTLSKESILCLAIAFQACTPKRLHFSHRMQWLIGLPRMFVKNVSSSAQFTSRALGCLTLLAVPLNIGYVGDSLITRIHSSVHTASIVQQIYLYCCLCRSSLYHSNQYRVTKS